MKHSWHNFILVFRREQKQMSIVDEETRQLLLRKTWCHGQAVLPVYSIILLFWWYHLKAYPQLVLAAITLPIWAWFSYQWVHTKIVALLLYLFFIARTRTFTILTTPYHLAVISLVLFLLLIKMVPYHIQRYVDLE